MSSNSFLKQSKSVWAVALACVIAFMGIGLVDPASAAYSFVRFSGGAVAPWLAGKLREEINVQLPFYVGAFAVVLAVGVLATGWKPLSHLRVPSAHSEAEATALTTADA